jgi:hypothetical protein
MQNRSVHTYVHGRLAALLAALVVLAFTGTALASPVTSSDQGSASADSYKLSIGSTGKAVRAVQKALHVRVTGYFGNETATAVRRFQRKHHFKANGVVDDRTASAMGVRLRKASSGSGGARAGSSSSGTHSSVRLPAELKKIAKCESGGNPRALSRSGRYRGKYQFDLSTWRSIGGHGDPAAASEDEQDRLALKLYRKRGTAPWPNCA